MSYLVRRERLRDLISLREAMDRLFEESYVSSRGRWLQSAKASGPSVDMYETEEAIVVKANLPGIKPDDISVEISGDVLTIRGETKWEEEVKEDRYLHRERFCGSFCRSVTIPAQVVSEDAEAHFEDGVLTLTLPRAESVKPKSIKVRIAK
jgi:HSP20 family protein